MSKHPVQSEFAFAMARSQFMNAQASVEEAINDRLRGLKAKVHPNHSANIKALLKEKPAPQFSKQTKGKIDEALARLGPIQDIRNSIVHGRMTVLKIDQQDHAMFANIQQPSDLATQALLLHQLQFDRLVKTLGNLATIIREA